MTCTKHTATSPGAAFGETCCQHIPGMRDYCVDCQYDKNGNALSCSSYYARTTANTTGLPPTAGNALPPTNNTGTVTNGQTGLPGRLGTLPPPSGNNSVTPGKTSIFNPLRNATNAAPGNTSNGTLAPGGIFKVTPGTTSAPGNNTGPLPAQTITKEHNPASPNVFSPAGNTMTNASSSNTNSTGH